MNTQRGYSFVEWVIGWAVIYAALYVIFKVFGMA
jgi:hypothetical protein